MPRVWRVVHRRVQRFCVVAQRKGDRHQEGCGWVDLVEQTHEVRRAHWHLRDADSVAATLHHGGEKHLWDREDHRHGPNERQGSVDPRRAGQGPRGGAGDHSVFGSGGGCED